MSNMNQFAKVAMLDLLRAYKWAVSPIFPPACRYVPTCSEYAMEAVERYGAVRGGLMAVLRLLRCHPFAPGGYDPVLKRHIGCGMTYETKTRDDSNRVPPSSGPIPTSPEGGTI
jgi:putative membrane protein insertion efficiency factor